MKLTCFYIIIHVCPLQHGERRINPMYLSFPLAYKYMKYVKMESNNILMM
jgi:hypothetical protein